MSDEELERLARAAAEAVGAAWVFNGSSDGVVGWVESLGEKANITPPGYYEGEWDAHAGRFTAAFNPATALALLERVRKAEAALLCEHGAEKEYCAASFNAATENAKRSGLLLALKQAEDVEQEEVAAGHADSASGAEEVKDRIADRIRWLDDGLEAP